MARSMALAAVVSMARSLPVREQPHRDSKRKRQRSKSKPNETDEHPSDSDFTPSEEDEEDDRSDSSKRRRSKKSRRKKRTNLPRMPLPCVPPKTATESKHESKQVDVARVHVSRLVMSQGFQCFYLFLLQPPLGLETEGPIIYSIRYKGATPDLRVNAASRSLKIPGLEMPGAVRLLPPDDDPSKRGALVHARDIGGNYYSPHHRLGNIACFAALFQISSGNISKAFRTYKQPEEKIMSKSHGLRCRGRGQVSAFTWCNW